MHDEAIASARHDSGHIPIIDLGLSDGSADARADEITDAVGRACSTSGFFVVMGHGVSEGAIHAVYREVRKFFHLPIHVRRQVSCDAKDPFSRGFKAGPSPQHLLETFSANRLGEEGSPARLPDELSTQLRRPNIWPPNPRFRSAFLNYYVELERLSMRLMTVFARALNLDNDWFEDKFDEHMATLTANYYPPVTKPLEDGQLRLGMHRDWGNLTVLYQDESPGGLQVLDHSNHWHDVPAIPGSFVVNVGSLLSIWTNARWLSSIHRVVPPPPDALGRERFSIAFFHQPNFDALIECIPSCQSSSDPPRYPSFKSGTYVLGSWAANHKPSDQTG